MSNAVGSRAPRRYFSWQNSIKTPGAIKYLAIDHTLKRKRCTITCRFTSRSPICDTVKIHRGAAKNVRKAELPELDASYIQLLTDHGGYEEDSDILDVGNLSLGPEPEEDSGE